MASMPEKYKHLSPYLTLSNEHAKRDPAIHYWCLVYFVQRAIEIDKKSPDCTAFLGEKLKYLEEFKAQNRQLREITDELEAQCHLEEYSKKLFTFADNSDRSGVFNKNIVKAFHSAAHLMDVLTTFGELSESIAEMRKYARWKAAYLFTCMKEGLVPVPGPMEDAEGKGGVQGDSTGTVNAAASSSRSPAQEALSPRGNESLNGSQSTNEYEKSLTRSEEYSKAQKLCKYAISALEYEDINTAIDNISKALELLKAERGYLLVKLKTKTFRMNTLPKNIIFCSAVVINAATVFSIYDYANGHPWSLVEKGIYASLSRLTWPLTVGAVIVWCRLFPKSAVSQVMSMDLWNPLAKLTYGVALIHPLIIASLLLTLRDTFHLTILNAVYNGISVTAVSYLVALVLYLCVEGPMLNIRDMYISCEGTSL